jgi:hypothetical protein
VGRNRQAEKSHERDDNGHENTCFAHGVIILPLNP